MARAHERVHFGIPFNSLLVLLCVFSASSFLLLTGCTGTAGEGNFAPAISSGGPNISAPANPIPPPTPSAQSSTEFVYLPGRQAEEIFGFSLNEGSGQLSVVPGFPLFVGGFPSMMAVDPLHKLLFLANGNGADPSTAGLYTYKIDATTGSLSQVAHQSGQFGDMALSPDSRFIYAASPGPDGFGAVSGFEVGPNGELSEIAGSPFPSSISPSELAVSPSGTLLFSAFNTGRGARIQVFPRSASGTLGKFQETGIDEAPTSIHIHPSGMFLLATYNGNGGTLVVYSIGADGTLTSTASSPTVLGGQLCCVSTDPTGQFVTVSNTTSDNISVFSMNSVTGELSPVAGSPFAAGHTPTFVAFSSSGNYLLAVQRESGTVTSFQFDSKNGQIRPGGSPSTVVPGSGNIVIVH